MTDTALTTQAEKSRALVTIKVVHTVVWAFFAACTIAIPVAGLLGQFGLAWILTGAVLVECLVLAVNGGRCPLTPIAARFTGDRTDAFDIYLPEWLARWNKILFGTLFVAGEIFTLCLWFRSS